MFFGGGVRISADTSPVDSNRVVPSLCLKSTIVMWHYVGLPDTQKPV